MRGSDGIRSAQCALIVVTFCLVTKLDDHLIAFAKVNNEPAAEMIKNHDNKSSNDDAGL